MNPETSEKMPHTESAKKALRQNLKRRDRNRAVKRAMKVQIKKFLASLKVMCAGRGGTSGSVLNSMTTGVSAASASSHAARMLSGSSQKMPFSPISSAKRC